MTLHEETTRAEIIRAQIILLNETLALVCENPNPTVETKNEITGEILRLSKLIK